MATRKQDYTFAQKIPEDFKCMICLDVLQEPQLTNCCGQHFCKTCLERFFQTKSRQKSTMRGQGTDFHGGLRAETYGQHQFITMGQLYVQLIPTLPEPTAALTGTISGRQITQLPINPTTKEQKQCPHCQASYFNYMIDLPLKRKINNLKVNCPNEGCKENITLGNVESHHMHTCGFLPVECTNKCGMSILKKDLQYHLKNKCCNRIVHCFYCKQLGTYKDIVSHTHSAICPDLPFQCDNNCGQLKIKRRNMSQHKQICPEEIVPCTFDEAGCTEKIKRKDLNSHVSANVQQHLSLLMAAYMNMKQELQTLKKGMQ